MRGASPLVVAPPDPASREPARAELVGGLTDVAAAVLAALPDAVVVEHGGRLVANDAARAMLDLAGDAEHPFSGLEALTLDGEPFRDAARLAALATGEPQPFRVRVRRPDGSESVLDGTVSPLDGDDGAVWSLRDVTREHNREALKERFLEELFDALPIAVLVSDPATGEVLTVNRAFGELLGFPLDEAIGRRPPYPWLAAGAAPPRLRAAGARTEQRYRQRGGSTIPVEAVTLDVRTAHGAPAASVTLVSDLSERRRLERQLVQSGKLAALGELAAGVAHEINNPLFAILGIVEFLLEDEPEGTKRRERLLLVQRTGFEIREIVRALLDFARERTDEHAVVSLADVAAETLALVRRTTLAKDVELAEEYGEGPFFVRGSANQLKQIFLNLVTNAQQAMPGGGHVTVSLEREHDVVRALVVDDGPGIDEDTQARIFEPFFTTKRDRGGTGLGLSVSLGIAHMHGGDLTVGSTPGRGSTFTLTLPACDGATTG